jgi:hypothetical protein
MQTENTYKAHVYCSNCGYNTKYEYPEGDGRMTIEKGKQVEVQDCPRCGCKTLQHN